MTSFQKRHFWHLCVPWIIVVHGCFIDVLLEFCSSCGDYHPIIFWWVGTFLCAISALIRRFSSYPWSTWLVHHLALPCNYHQCVLSRLYWAKTILVPACSSISAHFWWIILSQKTTSQKLLLISVWIFTPVSYTLADLSMLWKFSCRKSFLNGSPSDFVMVMSFFTQFEWIFKTNVFCPALTCQHCGQHLWLLLCYSTIKVVSDTLINKNFNFLVI